jgi:hypothetical protein
VIPGLFGLLKDQYFEVLGCGAGWAFDVRWMKKPFELYTLSKSSKFGCMPSVILDI